MMVQMGARRNYVYATQLEEAGLLHSLVTDAAWATDAKGAIFRNWISKILPTVAGKMSRRIVPAVPSSRIRATFIPTIMKPLQRLMHAERAYVILDYILGFRFRFLNIENVAVVVNYQGNGGPLLTRAKRHGAMIVSDFIITPRNLEIEIEERHRWPGWEDGRTNPDVVELYINRLIRLIGISDLYFCPSDTVVRDLASLPGFDPQKVRILPYGISGVQLKAPSPVTGRVVFVGEAGLRKGLPYLAEAATILKSTLPECEILVAGHASQSIQDRPETANLRFLGALNRDQMAELYANADVFCLPSLAEGSATSAFEAMANGLPIVTTRSSGTMVRHGVDGLLVPERDSKGLAAAILSIVSDRRCRERFSRAALIAAQKYSDKNCGDNFIDAINSLVEKGTQKAKTK